MSFVGIKDMFKISIGPSSSHTMGPWVAALDLCDGLIQRNMIEKVERVEVVLQGSLAKTGIGHHTPMGVTMGLCGEKIDEIDSSVIPGKIESCKNSGKLKLGGRKEIPFSSRESIVFDLEVRTTKHPNTLVFIVGFSGQPEERHTYYSVGGGFIEKDDDNPPTKNSESSSKSDRYVKSKTKDILPYPFTMAKGIQEHIDRSGLRMHQILLANEEANQSEKEVRDHAQKIYQVMSESIFRGCHSGGVLPGGLKVTRRAPILARQLYRGGAYTDKESWFKNIRETASNSHEEVSRWVSCFALAVNEENATCGRIVTAPTNGAAGVIPSILMYFLTFDPSADIDREEKIFRFLLIAAHIGFLFKENATISAAAGGCQGEIGVSSAMASSALTYVKGGDSHRAMMSGEIAMEHHLGLTCDPIKGLVQVPCIERNTMGAAKAITASQLSFSGDPSRAVVNLDQVIKTMWETANDMNEKYKETSEGGLATNVSINYSEC